MKDISEKKRKFNILMVEDEEVSQDIAQAIIANEMQCNLDLVEAGREALRLARDTQYDLIFIDLGLLDVDGFTVAETIHREYPKNAKTPIIAITAHNDRSFKARATKLGFAAYIVKPLTHERFCQILSESLGVNL